MLPEAHRGGGAARAGAAPARCRECGRRVARADPGCPQHGPAVRQAGQEPCAAGGADDTGAGWLGATAPPRVAGYRVTRLAGVGGFGAVFAAEPEGGGRAVAIKVARADRADARARLVEEMRALRDIGPPHVPAVYASGELASGLPYFVMEYLDAPTLADRLIAPGAACPLPPREACALARAALRALDEIHARGYVHRDIKPENIFVSGAPAEGGADGGGSGGADGGGSGSADGGGSGSADGGGGTGSADGGGGGALRATIIDLGLAAGGRGRRLDLTAVRDAPGTAEYMAPEQCDGRGDVDARADVYALGVVLFELLTGRPPFWGPAAVVRQDHVGRRPPRPSSLAPIPRSLEQIVLRCLAKDPGQRFDSAAALCAALEAFERAQERRPSRPSPAAEPPATSGRGVGRRAVALLFFEADLDVVALQRRLSALGGQLAHAAGRRAVAVFDHEDGASPLRRAMHAARELEQQRVLTRGLLDLATVSVQTRPDGARRFLSPLFHRDDRLAQAGAAGIALSPAAAAALGDGDRATPAGDGVAHGAPHGASPSSPGSAPGAPPGPASVQPGSSFALADADTAIDVSSQPFFGRTDVLDALVAGARRAVTTATPTIASVIGVAGQGKSRLAGALVKRLRALDGRAGVIELRTGEPVAGGGADRVVREILQQALGLPSSPPPGGGRELLRRRLGPSHARLGGAVALALGWISDGAPAAERYPELRALAAAPGALRAALAVAAGEALRRRSHRTPLFVVLDDAHEADDAALAALEYAALAEARSPLFICALARPTFESARPSFGERAARRETHRLEALDRESALALCRRLLLPAEDVPEPALTHLVERAQGVPLLLVELVRGLKREGIVRRHPRGDAWYLATDELDRLPDMPLLDWLALGEIDALPPALQAHARLVALLGPDVTVAEVAGVLQRLDEHGEAGDLPLDAAVAVKRLLAAGLLVQDRRGRIGFRHALFREAVARGAPEPLRRRVHLAAFKLYRDAAGDGGEGAAPHDPEARLLPFAYHAAQAGLSEAAEAAYLTLAERARARHAYLDAETFYSRALEQPLALAAPGAAAPASAPRAAAPASVPRAAAPASAPRAAAPASVPASAAAPASVPSAPRARPDRAAAHRGRGLMRYRLGRYHDALADLASARAIARARGDVPAQIDILLDEATALDWMDEFKSSEERVEEARALAAGIALSPALAARLSLGVGRSLHRFSREEEAAAALERAAAAAASLGDEGYETLVISLLMLGFVLQGLGRLDDAEDALGRAIALCEAHRDTLHLGSVTNNRALLWACRGDKARMIADLERVLSLARELGQSGLERVGEYNLGEYLYLMDDLEAAKPHIERALEIEQRRFCGACRPVALLLKARFLFYCGEEAEARALFERMREMQEQARAEGRADALMAPSEEVLCAMIGLATGDGGDGSDGAWDALVERSAQSSVGQEHVEVLEIRAVTALRRGRLAAARAALSAALRAAERIPNVMGDRLRRHAAAIAELDADEPALDEATLPS
ncbi:serine/threonine-protein kinase [Sorangium sp. So ce513]|uniref:serine/threonine-protein kinase n=1 Tax=Sorangium sp. So ce513 TaxID=3133315 RepID=UPI003F5E9CD6